MWIIIVFDSEGIDRHWYGPFYDASKAVQWADDRLPSDNWRVQSLLKP